MARSKKSEVARLLADPDEELCLEQVLERAGASRDLFFKWVNDGSLKDELRKNVDMFADMEYAAIFKALITKCRSGDLSAIKLFMELKSKKGDEVIDKDFNINVKVVE